MIQKFKNSKIQGFKDSKIQGFKDSKIQGFKGKFQRSNFKRIVLLHLSLSLRSCLLSAVGQAPETSVF
jgi:hypothetical protein